MASSLLLLGALLVFFTQNMAAIASLASKRTDIQNVVDLEYKIVRPEPKPTLDSPPELVEPVPEEVPPSLEPEMEPVLQEVQERIPEPPPVVKKKVEKLEEVESPKPIKAIRKKKKSVVQPKTAATAPQQPVKAVLAAESLPEPAAYEQAQVDSIPAPVNKAKPKYPYRARRMNITGFVEIRFLVNTKGYVVDLQILNAEPVGVFDKSVRKAVAGWRFNPGIKNNRSVATWMTTTINFEFE